MATSQTRARPRKAGTTEASKAPAARKTLTAKTTVAKKTVAGKAAVKKAPVKKAVASSVPKTAGKVAGTAKPAVRKTASAATKTKTPAAPPSSRTRVKPNRSADLTERLHTLVVTALADLKAKDVQQIDVRGKSSVTDLMVVVSGTSSRHVKSIADEVVKQAKAAGLPPIGVEGQREGEWVLVDLGDIIVHVMLPRTREFYDLERLWTVGDDDVPAVLDG